MTKESGGQTTAVQVALRIRPLTDRDRAQPRFANLANDDVLKIHENTVQVVPQNKLFTFDHVFGTNSTQDQIFSALGDNLIRKFVEGYNITILAYGQTSSGKTYTMGTAADGGHNTKDEGIVPRSMALLFDLLNNNTNEPARPISPESSISSSTSASNKSQSRLRPKSRIANRSSHIPQVPNSGGHKTKFTVKVSFIEIYNEDLHDLLNSAPLEELPPITIREDTKGRIYWTGVKEVLVHSTDDVLYYLEQGTQNRATGSTDMNEKSSRSHAIFSVSLKQEKWMPSTTSQTTEKKRPASSMSTRSSITPKTSRLLTAGADQDEGEWLITTSKFHFVDLAGSERLKRTAAEGDRRKEGININAGLLALGNVISALGDPSKKNKIHVPYRDSKLTRLLQDSLGGSATTLMIACASPVEYNLAETLNTLQYANRARNIKNKSEKNQVEEWMTTENIELLRSLIGKLKNELNYVKSNSSPTALSNKDDDDDDDRNNEEESYYHDQRMLISDLQRQVEELDGEASVTRERNRIVEKELQRVRLLESMMQNKEEEEVDFQHLVEPVIEEYEKSVSKLESQLALTKAALNHSDMGFEEQQNKLQQLETLIRSQEQTISELRLRLGKVLEREQSNESYILELETKLMKSANETTKDQEMLNELKNRIMKFKETDENTEQYIHSLEQRLASGDAERSRLRTCVEDLEAKIEAKERTNVELLKRLSKTTSNTSTDKLILKELDQVNAKYVDLEKERDSLQQQVKDLQKENHRISSSSSTVNEVDTNNSINNNGNATLEHEMKSDSLTTPPKFKNRKSFADETETPASVAALSLLQSESRVKEETERANRLQLTLDRLQYDHQETLKELDEVLQRYHETLEQLDFERDSSSTTAHEEDMIMTKSLDLSKEIAQAKEDAHEQEKQAFVKQIANLQQALSKQKAEVDSNMSNRIQKLEHELAVANKQVYILKQMESEHNATAEVEHILENLDSPPAEKEDHKLLLELKKQQTKHWKVAHSELKQDMEKMILDLDEKEQYIAQLKQQVDDSTTRQGQLQTSLDEANQQSTSLQKRLAETLASLTVLKIAHDGLQKKQSFANSSSDTELVARHKQEKKSLLDKHQTELANVQQTIADMDQVLKNTTLEKETALQKIVALDNQLKEQTDRIYLEQEKIIQDHEAHVSALTKEFEAQSNDLKEKMASLETELEMSKDIHEETLIIHNQRLREATTQRLATVHELEEQVHSLQTELIGYQASLKEAQSQHCQQMSVLKSELNSLKSLHADRLQKLSTEHQLELEAIKSENEKLMNSYQNNLREISSQQHSETTAQQLSVLQQELNDIKNLHAEQLQKLILEHSKELEVMKSESEKLAASHQDSLRQLNSQHSETIAKQLNDLKKLHAEQLQQLNMEHSKALEAAANEKLTSSSSHQDTMREISSQNSETTTTTHQQQQMNALQQELVQAKSLHADQLDKLKLEHYKTLKEHERIVSSHQDHLREMEFQLAEKDQSLIVLQEEFEQLKALNIELEAENEQCIMTQQALQTELKNTKQVESSHQQKMTTLESLLAVAKTEQEAGQVDLKSTREQLDMLQKEHTGLTEKMVRLESELLTAKADHVTLAQTHQAQLAEALSQQEQRILKLNKEQHSKEVGDKHSESLANLVESQQQQADEEEKEEQRRGQGAVTNELTQEVLEMLRTTNLEKEETIHTQRQTIEKHLLKINELSDKIAKLQFAASLFSKQQRQQQQDDDNTNGQQKLYEDRIAQLEQQIKQIGEENIEYTSLAEELEKEIQRMTLEKEALAEDLDLSEESLQAYQQKMNDMKSILGVMLDEQVENKIKELLLERSMSIAATSETQCDHQSSVNNNKNDTLNEKGYGSRAISQQHGTQQQQQQTLNTEKEEEEEEEERQRQQQQQAALLLKKELENCQHQMKDMVSRDKMMSLEKQLEEEKQKLDQSEKTIKKLEKQLEELLKKKSSFMCF